MIAEVGYGPVSMLAEDYSHEVGSESCLSYLGNPKVTLYVRSCNEPVSKLRERTVCGLFYFLVE